MTTAIIITTINPPTKTVLEICRQGKADLIVIGDNKSPDGWECPGATYFDVDRQREVMPQIADILPYNHYCRKNLGYLFAVRDGAEIIVDTDDDNIPNDDWYIPKQSGEFDTVSSGKGFVNAYSAFTDQHIWPRGLPLQDVLSPNADLRGSSFKKKLHNVGVWQGLANGDPDVDAIYRLVINKPCTFEKRDPLVLDEGVVCPYNSQNTITYKEFFPLLYLPCFVNFRFTDILRGLIGQVILWDHGARLGFFEATVFQDRNEHDFFKDFVDEDPCYRYPYDVIDVVKSSIRSGASVADQLIDAYRSLSRNGIVDQDKELPVLEPWLSELT
ncbi:MAG: DUF288 domain-containing protein [Pseudomonadota bacterium]